METVVSEVIAYHGFIRSIRSHTLNGREYRRTPSSKYWDTVVNEASVRV